MYISIKLEIPKHSQSRIKTDKFLSFCLTYKRMFQHVFLYVCSKP